ncbi:hypothetical protein AAGG74_14715 [Bacillus mexicanus]|uniref:hypothetical protein n=1 Tax=Bacillus mexicanus TaxID=2834415 RepID=UPI003D223BAF
MDIKNQLKLNHLVYLFVLQKLNPNNPSFLDTLVHIYRTFRFKTTWRIDKSFVAYEFQIVDPEKDRILNSLYFFGYINKEYTLTSKGESYLRQELNKNETLKQILDINKNINDIAYENSCLSPSLPTTANCGLCKNLSCTKKTGGLLKAFSQYTKIRNYKKSYSRL